jgi:hypothetical protein
MSTICPQPPIAFGHLGFPVQCGTEAPFRSPLRWKMAAPRQEQPPAPAASVGPRRSPCAIWFFRSNAVLFQSDGVVSGPIRTRELIETDRYSFRHRAARDSFLQNPDSPGNAFFLIVAIPSSRGYADGECLYDGRWSLMASAPYRTTMRGRLLRTGHGPHAGFEADGSGFQRA